VDFPTFAGYVAAFVVALILNDWIKKGSEWLLNRFYVLGKRSLAYLKRQGIILLHRLFHILPTDDHNQSLYYCLDGHCDTLYVNIQALELPEEPELFDS
jgi:hypothetical protein